MMSGLLPPLASQGPRRCPTIVAYALTRSIAATDAMFSWDFPGLHLVAVTQAPSGAGPRGRVLRSGRGLPWMRSHRHWSRPDHGRDDRCALGRQAGADPVAQAPLDLPRGPSARWTTFVEQDPEVCAPRGLLSTRAIRWAIGQLRFEGATIQGLARHSSARPGTRSGPRSSPSWPGPQRDPSRFEGVQVIWAWTSTSGTTVTRAGAARRSSPGWST
jgi:transposase